MNDLIKRLRELHTAKRMAYPKMPEAGSAFGDAADALEQAQRLEREAFGAGLLAATNQFIDVFDKAKDIDTQQAWLDYRGLTAGESEPPAEHTCSLCGVVKPTAGDIDFEFRCNRKDCPGWQRFAPAHQSVPESGS